MIVEYHQADIPGGRSRGCPKMRIEVGSPGRTVTIGMRRFDGTQDGCWTELTVRETKKLIEGFLDAMNGRCNMSIAQRNRFCKALEVHPKNRL